MLAAQYSKKKRIPLIIGKSFPSSHVGRFFTRYPSFILTLSSLVFISITMIYVLISHDIVVNIHIFEPIGHPYIINKQELNAVKNAWDQEITLSIMDLGSNILYRRSIVDRVIVIFSIDKAAAYRHWNNQRQTNNTYGDEKRTKENTMNILSSYNDRYIRQVNRKLMRVVSQKPMTCWGSAIPLVPCVPPNHIGQYHFLGSTVDYNGSLYWSFSPDGHSQGVEAKYIDAIEGIFSNPRHMWYLDDEMDAVNRRASSIKETIALGGPVDKEGNPNGHISEGHLRYLYRTMQSIIDKETHPYIRVYIGGDDFLNYVITDAIFKDFPWMLGSLVFVLLGIRIQSHSWFIALFGTFQVLTLYPNSSMFCQWTSYSVSIFGVLSYYVAMLVSLCSQMIIFDAFKHSGIIPSSGCLNNLSVAQRISYVFRRAVSGVVATTVCSLCCFITTIIISQFDSLRDFSMQMCYILLLNLLHQFTLTPSVILVHHYHLSHRRRNMQQQKEVLIENSVRGRPIAQVEFHEGINNVFVENGFPSYVTMLDIANKQEDREVTDRANSKGLIWRLNLKPYFSKIKRKIRPNKRYAMSPTASEGVEERENEMSVSHQENTQNNNIFTQDLSTVVRIEAFNTENLHMQNGSALTNALRALGDISTLPKFRLDVLAQRMGITSHLSDASEHIQHITRLIAYHIESHGWAINIEVPSEVRRMKRDARPPPPPENNKVGYKERFINFIKDRRNRKFQCFGSRNETPEERRNRIMELSIKHEGYNRMERFFAGPFTRATGRFRCGIMTVLMIMLLSSICMIATLSLRTTSRNFLPEGNPADAFYTAHSMFPFKGHCDFCAPYFVERHPINATVLDKCFNYRGYYSLRDVEVNSCGECTTDSSLPCFPCDHDTPGAVMDKCGRCLLESDPRRKECLYSLPMTNKLENICKNQLFGPSCKFCKCYNGGQCDGSGKCHCVGNWSGADCSSCEKCGDGAFCPVQWSPSHYSYFTCRELFCTVGELIKDATIPGTPCAMCDYNRTTSNCNFQTRKCDSDTFSTIYPRNTCKCRGNFTGSNCDICQNKGNPQLTCDKYGTLVGCDGKPSKGGKYVIVDECGVCNGRNECLGSGGELNSSLKFHSRGNCSGNGCQHTTVKSAYVVDVLWKVPRMTSLVALHKLVKFCMEAPSDIIRPMLAQCYIDIPELESALYDATWENTTASRTKYIKLLFDYSRMNAMTDRVVFTSADPADPKFDLKYIIATFRSKIARDTPPYDVEEGYKRWNDWLSRSPFNSTMSSEAWETIAIRQAIKWDCLSIVIISFAATMWVVSVYTCSFRIFLAAAIILLVDIMWVVGVIRIFSEEFGPESIVAVLLVYSMSLSALMFMSEGYVEQLHYTQSHLLAVHSTRKENVKGMLRRTGVPVALSTVIVFLSSLLLLGTQTQLFYRIACIIAVSSVCIGGISLFGFSSLMVTFGPAKTHRTIPMMLLNGTIGLAVFMIVISFVMMPRFL